MNLFIGNLEYSISSERLEELFSKFGEVKSAKVITDRVTGKSKGFGFVEVEGKSNAYNAIEELNGSEVEGRRIVVNKAHPKTGGGPPGPSRE